jgi:C4-type Zn-finger protein
MTTDSATQEIDRLQKIFEDRKADLRCPVCGTETQMVMSCGSVNAGPPYESFSPSVVVACQNCGFVRHFIKEFLFKGAEPQNGG